MHKRKQLEAYLFSTIGVVLVFIIGVALYVLSGVFKQRVDLTDEKLYTLSTGTKAILAKLDTPVEIRFYCTQDSKDMPVPLKTYARRVEDLLKEYEKAARGNLEVKKLDPRPDSDAEDSANLDGVEGQMLSLGSDRIFLGVAISMLDEKVALPFLHPQRERLLEYDLTRAISRVVNPQKPVVGVMTPLPAFGEINPMAMRMGQMQRQNPWTFISELKRDFDVKQVEMTVEEIPADIKVLLVVHPKNISEKAQFAIDQFVLRGGKLVAFVDPYSIVDAQNQPGNNPLQSVAQGGSSMDKLFKAWGVEFDQNKVIADRTFITQINRGGRAESSPAFLSVNQKGLDANDVITSEIDSMLVPFGGVFAGTPADGLKQTVLVKTTSNSQLVDRFMAEFSGEQIIRDFVPSGKEQAIVMRLMGKFKTAFPDGKPKDTPPPGDNKDAPPAPSGDALKEAAAEGTVVLIADSDMLADHFAVRVQNFFGQRIVEPMNGNLSFVQNLVEQLSGDSNLIEVRSRATQNRPFTVVSDLQARAQDRFSSKIRDLEKELQETQAKLGEHQRKKEGNQRFILSPEQQAEIQNFRKKEGQANKELKQVKKDLRREIDALETKLKIYNIAGMPVVVTVAGIALAILRRKKTAAK